MLEAEASWPEFSQFLLGALKSSLVLFDSEDDGSCDLLPVCVLNQLLALLVGGALSCQLPLVDFVIRPFRAFVQELMEFARLLRVQGLERRREGEPGFGCIPAGHPHGGAVGGIDPARV